jgi:hypothetical protein
MMLEGAPTALRLPRPGMFEQTGLRKGVIIKIETLQAA